MDVRNYGWNTLNISSKYIPILLLQNVTTASHTTSGTVQLYVSTLSRVILEILKIVISE